MRYEENNEMILGLVPGSQFEASCRIRFETVSVYEIGATLKIGPGVGMFQTFDYEITDAPNTTVPLEEYLLDQLLNATRRWREWQLPGRVISQVVLEIRRQNS